MKFLTIIGTRPNLTKIDPKLKQAIVWSGQHYDKNLKDLGLKLPKPAISIPTTHIGAMLDALLEIIENTNPEYVIVYGDTNTALMGAIAAKQCRKKLIHIEAGMRSDNMEMIEEQNRIMIDHISDILFVPSVREAERLERKEEVSGAIIVSGATQLDTFFQQFPTTDIKKYKGYMLLTLHRAETVDNKNKLGAILDALNGQGKIVWPIHPRTKKRLQEFKLDVPKNIELVAPMKYKKFVYLMGTVKKVLTDSGGIQPEAHFMRKDCITLRNETEWTQTVEQGWNTLVGSNKDAIRRAIAEPVNIARSRDFVYGKGDAKEKIRSYLQSL